MSWSFITIVAKVRKNHSLGSCVVNEGLDAAHPGTWTGSSVILNDCHKNRISALLPSATITLATIHWQAKNNAILHDAFCETISARNLGHSVIFTDLSFMFVLTLWLIKSNPCFIISHDFIHAFWVSILVFIEQFWCNSPDVALKRVSIWKTGDNLMQHK